MHNVPTRGHFLRQLALALCVLQSTACSSQTLASDPIPPRIELPGHHTLQLGAVTDTAGLHCRALARVAPDTVRTGDVFTVHVAEGGYACRIAPAGGVTGDLSLDSLARLNALHLWFDNPELLDSLRETMASRYGAPNYQDSGLSTWDDGRIEVMLTRLAETSGPRLLLEWIHYTRVPASAAARKTPVAKRAH